MREYFARLSVCMMGCLPYEHDEYILLAAGLREIPQQGIKILCTSDISRGYSALSVYAPLCTVHCLCTLKTCDSRVCGTAVRNEYLRDSQAYTTHDTSIYGSCWLIVVRKPFTRKIFRA